LLPKVYRDDSLNLVGLCVDDDLLMIPFGNFIPTFTIHFASKCRIGKEIDEMGLQLEAVAENLGDLVRSNHRQNDRAF
jgi:hypothetical protein